MMNNFKWMVLLPGLFIGQLAYAGPWSDVLDTPFLKPEKVQKMIHDGMDVNKAEASGWDNALQYPLSMVAGDNDASLAIRKMLLDAGAKVNQTTDKRGRTALHKDAITGNNRAVQLLLDRGAKVDVRDNDGKTPLLDAVYSAQIETVKILLQAGADIKARDKRGNTVLHIVKYGFSGEDVVPVAKLLVEHGADINAVSDAEGTTLSHAMSLKKKGLAEFLLKRGVDINIKNSEGSTSLHNVALVSSAGDSSLQDAAWLLDHGANLEARNNKGETPLMVAAKWGSFEMVQFLLNRGARADVQDNQGKNMVASDKKKLKILLKVLHEQQGEKSPPNNTAEKKEKRHERLNKVIEAYAGVVNKAGREYQQAKQKVARARGFSGLKTRQDVQARQKVFADFKDKSMTLLYLLKESKSLAWKAVQDNKVKATQQETEKAVGQKFGNKITKGGLVPLKSQFYWADAYYNVFTMLDQRWGAWSVDKRKKIITASDKDLQAKINKEMTVISQLETYFGQQDK